MYSFFLVSQPANLIVTGLWYIISLSKSREKEGVLMKYSVRLSDAIHILSYIEIFQGTDLSSETIAKSVNTNPVTVRKIMGELKKAHLIKTQNGKAEPKLTKSASDISLFEIYKSVDKEGALFHADKNTEPNCLIGSKIQTVLEDTYDDLQQIVEQKMKDIFLSDIIDSLTSHIGVPIA